MYILCKELEVPIMKAEFDMLEMENQICFPLYAASKEIIRRFKPFLDPFDLTYTQYITLAVLWEVETINVKTLGEYLYLDSGTMTPVLKKMENKGYITRTRSQQDERSVFVCLTDEGRALKAQASDISQKMNDCIKLSAEEMVQLKNLLCKALAGLA